jgi:2-C-methyl-D-erythritol 2,4-cyclodiphosphate synthase
MLQIVWHGLVEQGWRLVNLDCVVFAQRPKLAGYWPAIRRSIASVLTHPAAPVQEQQIGLKAKTGESVGHIGREEALAAQCVALVWDAGAAPVNLPDIPAGGPTSQELTAQELTAQEPTPQ